MQGSLKPLHATVPTAYGRYEIASQGTGGHVPPGGTVHVPSRTAAHAPLSKEKRERTYLLLAWLLGHLELAEPLDEAGVGAAGADLLKRGEIGVELAAVAAAERLAV